MKIYKTKILNEEFFHFFHEFKKLKLKGEHKKFKTLYFEVLVMILINVFLLKIDFKKLNFLKRIHQGNCKNSFQNFKQPFQKS